MTIDNETLDSSLGFIVVWFLLEWEQVGPSSYFKTPKSSHHLGISLIRLFSLVSIQEAATPLFLRPSQWPSSKVNVNELLLIFFSETELASHWKFKNCFWQVRLSSLPSGICIL